MTKEQKIKEAYGEYYEDIRLCIDKDGFCELGQKEDNDWGVEPFLNKEELDIVNFDSYSFKWRPKSLRGIENNNGWIKVETKEDLPDSKIISHYDKAVLYEDNSWSITKYLTYDELLMHFENDNLTHYMPVVCQEPPLY